MRHRKPNRDIFAILVSFGSSCDNADFDGNVDLKGRRHLGRKVVCALLSEKHVNERAAYLEGRNLTDRDEANLADQDSG
jgi:hypothetical protein